LVEAAPTRSGERALAAVALGGFRLSVGISAALLVGVLAFESTAAWLAWCKLVLGLAMAAEGVLLATDWRGARRLTLWQIRRRRPAVHQARAPLWKRIAWSLASPALQLVGVAWIAAGMLTAVLGMTRIV
jgi:hypothetical protein